MDINSTQDNELVCAHCETDVDDNYGTLGFHLDLGDGDTYTVCTTCTQNLVA